ncbi:hypothetical protein AOZ06_13135 [Kibdelosporangium phytohabitans]|uniref:DUF7426 domain-containing protein n=1 Tax=Kibdelosporangium phytohabitans TaxID=860235 RepID=A0A0N9HVY1_9PSEU|nr:hypothetical protein AOZ06_12815 [Kibdelosporangium phytohabitans]ALG07728.1 hypothetical protein AOZ06_13135 [Kibdelosporangium phytohabitans]
MYSFPVALSFELGRKMRVLQSEIRRFERAKKTDSEYTVKDTDREWITETELHEVYLQLIGEPMMERLKADGVTWPEVLHIGETLFAFHQVGLEAALLVWQLADGDSIEGDASPPADPPKTTSRSPRRTTSQSTSTKKKRSATNARRSNGTTSSTRGT